MPLMILSLKLLLKLNLYKTCKNKKIWYTWCVLPPLHAESQMLKKSVFCLIIWCCLSGIVSAHDCLLFSETSLKTIDNTPFYNSVKDNPALQMITKEGLHRALINLKTHCCASNIVNNNKKMEKSCKEDENLIKNRTNYPESSFLFDHLVDVMIRRLAIDGNYKDVSVDTKAQGWRKNIDQIANKAEWTIPPVLSQSYSENWSLQTDLLLPLYNGVSRGEYSNSIAKVESMRSLFWKYDGWNLNTKYLNICPSAIYLMSLLPIDFDSDELLLAQKNCEEMIQNSIDEKLTSFSHLIVHKSDRLLNQNMKQYADEYLINTRGTKFQENATRMLSNLLWVVRMISKLIPQCN